LDRRHDWIPSRQEKANMPTAINTTLSELRPFLDHLSLPSKTKLKIIFEDNDTDSEIRKRQMAIDAMGKLKGSGNGNLVDALLRERAKDRTR